MRAAKRTWDLIGDAELDDLAVSRAFAAGDYGALVDNSSDFVLHVQRGKHRLDRDVVVSSRSGLVNAYWSRADDGSLVVATTVAEVLTKCGRGLSWNHEAVADYLIFGHPLGDATIDRTVRRVAPGAVSIFNPGADGPAVEPATFAQEARGRSVDTVAEALLAAVPSDDAMVLSQSGGLDSRLLLAAMLHLGRRPRLVVSGVEGSFDRSVSLEIARRYRLPIEPITIDPAETARGAAAVVAATNGLLPATNWSGLAHLRAASLGVDPCLVLGFGGEYGRSYYARSTPLGLVMDRLAPRGRAGALISAAYENPIRAEEHRYLHPKLVAALGAEAVQSRLNSICHSLEGLTALDVADEFFLTQYCRQKLSGDLAAIATFARWRVPLLAPDWVDAVRRLPRAWKVGDRLHRRLIHRLFPDLLTLPEEGQATTTPSRISSIGLLRREPGVTGAPYLDPSLYSNPVMLDEVRSVRNQLGGLIDETFIDRLVGDMATSNESGRGRPQLCFSIGALGGFAGGLSVGGRS